MSDTIDDSQEQVSDQDTAPAPTPEPINVALAPNGLPLIISGGKEAVEHVKAQGHQIFYILTNLKYTSKTKDNKQVSYSVPRVAKYVSTLVGDALVEAADDELGLAEIESFGSFGMPKIPNQLVAEISEFFHHIYATLHTEAVVVLVYDEEKLDSEDPSSGWGFLVPEQENTAGSCDYTPMSVNDEKVDMGPRVKIVGSAHSHPGMSAFASHTDEGDQAQFDGVHITFGWPMGRKVDEHHIELLFQGHRFTMTPEQTFVAGEEEPSTSERIQELAKKVKRATPTHNYSSWGGGSGKDWSQGYGGAWGNSSANLKGKLPKGYEHLHPDKVTLIRKVLLTEDEIKDCPVCITPLYSYDKKGGYCWRCHSYFMLANEELPDLITKREGTTKGAKDLMFEPDSDGKVQARKSVWLWAEHIERDGDTDVFRDTLTPLYLTPADKAAHEARESGKAQGV